MSHLFCNNYKLSYILCMQVSYLGMCIFIGSSRGQVYPTSACKLKFFHQFQNNLWTHNYIEFLKIANICPEIFWKQQYLPISEDFPKILAMCTVLVYICILYPWKHVNTRFNTIYILKCNSSNENSKVSFCYSPNNLFYWFSVEKFKNNDIIMSILKPRGVTMKLTFKIVLSSLIY